MSEFMMTSFFQSGKIVIPLYQRNYDWSKQNCKQLLDDIERLIENSGKNKKHFTGAIIFTNSGLNRVIIDGQQRITTVQLLLLALRDSVESGNIVMNDSDNESYIRLFIGKKEKILKLCGKDDDAFKSLYDGKYNEEWSTNEYGGTNIWKNYEYLKFEIERMNDSPDFGDKLIDAIQCLWVVPIELKENDDPQAVFESINTTGKKLDDPDRIRNFIMMNHSEEEQQKIYDEYWKVIEKDLGDDIDQFFVDFLKSVTFTKVQSSNNGAYIAFKKQYPQVKEGGDEKWKILGKIRDSAMLYRGILDGSISKYSSEEASRAVRYINHMDQGTCYCFLLNLLSAQMEGILSKEEVSESILIIETYLERRQAAKFQTNALNGMFYILYKSVANLPGDAPFNDKLAYYLLSKQNNLRIPTDDEIKTILPMRDIYSARKDCEVILAIADHVNKDSPEILDKLGIEGGYTVDHILPQKPEDSWYDLIPNLDDFRKQYQNTIGNLSFTSYNSDFGNRSFDYRMNTKGIGYRYSPLHINDYLKKQDSWSKEQIEERAQLIIKDFLTNRPIFSTDYAPSYDDEMEVSFSEDMDVLTGVKILGFTYKGGQFIPTKNGVAAYLEILRRLYSDYPDEFTEWAESDDPSGYIGCFHTQQNDEGKYREIGPGVFVWKSMSHHDKFDILQKIIEDLGIDGSEVTIRYKMKSKSE